MGPVPEGTGSQPLLMIQAVATPLSVFRQSPTMTAMDEAFDKLCAAFSIEEKIRIWLTSSDGLACKSMADF